MTTAVQNETNVYENGSAGTTILWDQINEPGAYICNWSGHLVRVPQDGVARGRSPLVHLVANVPLFVTKIANDPFITVTKARMIASNLDMSVSF